MKKSSLPFSGVTTAIVTPFKQQKLDMKSFAKLMDYQLEKGVDGFVINGTTGESPTIHESEVKEMFQYAKSVVGPRHLILGTGLNSTEKSIEQSKKAEQLGADAVLVVVPYYNKPPQRGLIQHFKAVSESISIPTILYNVPGRTITSLEVESIQTLAQLPKIVGIKEATGNIDFFNKIKSVVPDRFVCLSGDDGTYDQFVQAGGNGVISVSSHIIPEAMKNVDIAKYKKLIDLLFIEANPIPVKMALYFMGIIESPELRLPLDTMDKSKAEVLKAEMKSLGMI